MTHIFEIDPANFAPGRALFNAAGVTCDRPYWEAPFDGDFPARLFVDDPVDPQSALLARSYEYYVAGNPSDALLTFLEDAPEAADPMQWFYGYVPLTPAWSDALIRRFPGLFHEDRRSFRLGAEGAGRARSWRDRLPESVEMANLTPELAARAQTEVPDDFEALIGGFGRLEQNYFGNVVIDRENGALLSVAFSAGVSRREMNIGVATAERARRQGLATLVCQACIAQALDRGLVVTWDCDLLNTGSGALAESLGFLEESPFLELCYIDPERGMPHRVTPPPSGVAWSRTSIPEGGVSWRRES